MLNTNSKIAFIPSPLSKAWHGELSSQLFSNHFLGRQTEESFNINSVMWWKLLNGEHLRQLAAKLLRHFEEKHTLLKNNPLTDKIAINFPLHPHFPIPPFNVMLLVAKEHWEVEER